MFQSNPKLSLSTPFPLTEITAVVNHIWNVNQFDDDASSDDNDRTSSDEVSELSLLAGLLLVAPHICRLACLEQPYILSLLAGPLLVVAHICWLACLEHPYILSLLAGPPVAGPDICWPACMECR